MNHTDSYYNYLLECAKAGSHESFIELIDLLHNDVFCTAFQLVDDYDLAFDITKSTFVSVWNNMNRYEGEKDCNHWIREITIILCFFHLKEKQERKTERAITYIHMAKVEDNPLEEAYSTLKFYQKISVILASKLKFSLYDMRNVFDDLSETEVRDLYQDAMHTLTKACSRVLLKNLSREEVQTMVNAEERGDIKLSGFKSSTLHSIDKFKDELDNIFTTIKPDPTLIEEIKEQFVLEEDEEERDPETPVQAIKDKKILKSNYDKALKSAIDDFIVKNKLFLSSKKIKQFSLAGHLNRSLIGIGVFMLVSTLAYFFIENSLSNTPWQIQSNAGTHNIVAEYYSDELYANDILRTVQGSDISIIINDFGKLNIKGKAELKLENGKISSNEVFFQGDSLEFSADLDAVNLHEISDDPRLTIILETCSLRADVSNFTLTNSIRYYELYVKNGVVRIQKENSIHVVGKGYWKDLKNNVSVPVYKETSSEVRAVAIDPSNLSLKLEKMLPKVEDHDILTLWHLMKIAPKKERELIVDKIVEILPILDKSTVAGLKALNEDDVDSALNLINWMLIEDIF